MIIRPEEWITEPDENGNGFLEGWTVSGDIGYPIPIETHNVALKDVLLGEEQDFDFILECAERPEVYADEEAYLGSVPAPTMAAEAVIPSGLFSPGKCEEFTMSPRMIMNGRVTEIAEDAVQYGFEEGDILFNLSCCGTEFSIVLHGELSEDLDIKEGNIVSCVYWVQGWPREDTE